MYRLFVAAFAWAGASSASSTSAPATAAATAQTSAGPRSRASPSAELGLMVLLGGDDTGPPVLGHPASFPLRPPIQRGNVAPSGAGSRNPRGRRAAPRGAAAGAARLPGEKVDDLDEGVVEPVGKSEPHDHPEEDRERRSALGIAGARGAVVHRHVAHEPVPPVVVMVPDTGEAAVAGSPSRTKRSSRSVTGSWKRSSTGRIIRLAMKPTTRTPTMMNSEIV